MFRKILIKFMRSIGYVRKEYLTLAHLEIRGLEKELQKITAQCENLLRDTGDLKKELAILYDENQSLWGMLDELQSANNFGTDQVKSMMQDIEEAVTDEMLKNFKPVGEA